MPWSFDKCAEWPPGNPYGRGRLGMFVQRPEPVQPTESARHTHNTNGHCSCGASFCTECGHTCDVSGPRS